MKNFLSFLLIVNVFMPIVNLSALPSTETTEQRSVLTTIDLNKISGKKHSDQAWKKIDQLLTFIILLGAGTSCISSLVPTGIHTFKVPVYKGKKYFTKEGGCTCCGIWQSDFDEDEVCKIPYPTFDIATKTFEYSKQGPCAIEDNVKIVKPYLIGGCITATSLAILAKILVKLKRAKDHEKNIMSFMLAELFAK